MKQVDYLIVGQGLAGSIFAYTLIKNNKSFVIIDNGLKNNASLIGAGMFCPISGKRMTKSWMIDELLQKAVITFKEIEEILNIKILYHVPIYQVFGSVKEQNDLMSKLSDNSFALYVDEKPKHQDEVIQPFGAFGIKHGGWINTSVLIKEFRNYFIKNQLLFDENFEHNCLKVYDNQLDYKNIKATKIVFCEGVQSQENPYFPKLPFKFCKGEILIIKTNFDTDVILKKGIYLIRIQPYTYRVGSTYNWNDFTLAPTEDGYHFLKQKTSELIGNNFDIINHEAGIRPTIVDRKPILGQNQHHRNIFIFNGLGTKGILNAPYFSNMMFEFAELNKPVLKEVDLNRFKNKHYSK